MNKKLLLVSILAVFMLLAISMASAVNATIPIKKKESPLFGIRTRRAIKEGIGQIIENIKTKYIGERVFFLPFHWYFINGDDIPLRLRLHEKKTIFVPTKCSSPVTECSACTEYPMGGECTP